MSAVPAGSHTITPQIVVKGASGAIDLYKAIFGAVERVRVPVAGTDKIYHAVLGIGDTTIFVQDELPDSILPNNTVAARFYIYVDNADAQHERALKAGMQQMVTPQDMPWGDRVSIVLDRYGVLWHMAARVKK